MALRMAQQSGPNAWQVRAVTEETKKTPAGAQNWKRTLEEVLSARRIHLVVQAVSTAADRKNIHHLEIFSKIIGEGDREFRAEIFLPFAERFRLMPLLDRIVLEEVMRLDRHQLGVTTVAVNLSPMSLTDQLFREWLEQTLQALPLSAPRLIFEFTEFAAIRNLDTIKEFRDSIKQWGHAISLDHYGQSLSKLSYLQFLLPDFVKVTAPIRRN